MTLACVSPFCRAPTAVTSSIPGVAPVASLRSCVSSPHHDHEYVSLHPFALLPPCLQVQALIQSSVSPTASSSLPPGFLKASLLPLLVEAPSLPSRVIDLLAALCGLEKKGERGRGGGGVAVGQKRERDEREEVEELADECEDGMEEEGRTMEEEDGDLGEGEEGWGEGQVMGAVNDLNVVKEGMVVLWRLLVLRPPVRWRCLSIALRVREGGRRVGGRGRSEGVGQGGRLEVGWRVEGRSFCYCNPAIECHVYAMLMWNGDVRHCHSWGKVDKQETGGSALKGFSILGTLFISPVLLLSSLWYFLAVLHP